MFAVLSNLVGLAATVGGAIFAQKSADRESELLRKKQKVNSDALKLKKEGLQQQRQQAISKVSNTASGGSTFGGLGSNQLQKTNINQQTEKQSNQLQQEFNLQDETIDDQVSKNNYAGAITLGKNLESMFGDRIKKNINDSFFGG